MKTQTTNRLSLITSFQKGQKNFYRQNLSQLNLSNTDFNGCNFSFANLQGADLSFANFSNCNFRGANLKGANLSNANLDGANFTDAILNKANLNRVYAKNANFESAHLNKANLEQASLTSANFNKAYLNNANLEKANLRKSKITQAFLTGVNLKKTDLEKANISGTILTGVTIDKTCFRTAIYDDKTFFPAYFDPQKFKMLKMNYCDLTTEDILTAINYVINTSSNYFGKVLSIKYLKTCKPDNNWLNKFEIDKNGQVKFVDNKDQKIDDFQLKWFEKWVTQYIENCSKIIKNFRQIIDPNQVYLVKFEIANRMSA